MSGTISPKLAVNINNSDAYHYLDVVIPSSDTSKSINVTNTFQSTPVFYSDKYGNISLNGTLTCAQLNIEDTGILLPTTYTVLPGQTDLGYVKTSVPSASVLLSSGNYVTLCSMNVPTGVWLMSGNAGFNAPSVPNASIESVQLGISATAIGGGQTSVPLTNFNFGTTNSSTLYASTFNTFINSNPSQNYYLTLRLWLNGTASLQAVVSNTKLNAIRIG